MGQARDEAGNIWETDAQGNPVRLVSAAGQQQGSVFNLPPSAAEQATMDNTRRDDARADAMLPLRQELLRAQIRSAEAAAAKAEQGTAGAQAGDARQQARLANINSLVEQINRVQELYEAGPGATSGIAGLTDYLPNSENRQFDTAAAGMAEQGLAAFRVPGVGAQSDAELRQFVQANKPAASDYDATIEEKLTQLRTRVDATRQAMGLSPAEWTGIEQQPNARTPQANALTAPRVIDYGNGVEAAPAGATQGAEPINPEYQAEYTAWVMQNAGRFTPEQYDAFRDQLDQKYSYGPQDYTEEGARILERFERGGSQNLNIPPMDRPLSDEGLLGTSAFSEQARNNALNNPVGAALAGALDMGSFGGVNALLPQQMSALGDAQSLGVGVGQVAGSIGGTAALGSLARNTIGRVAPRTLAGGQGAQFFRNVGTDAAYSGAYGGISGGDPLTSAAFGTVGSVGGQGVGKAIGGAVSGVTSSPTISRLYQQGVQPTLGQIARGRAVDNGGRSIVAGIEDTMANNHVLGTFVNNARNRALEQGNLAAFNIGSQGAPITEIGEGGLRQLESVKDAAFDTATNGVSLPMLDSRFVRNFGDANRFGEAADAARGRGDFGFVMDHQLSPIVGNGGTIGGKQLQDALRLLQGQARTYNRAAVGAAPDPAAANVATGFDMVGDALTDLAGDYSPDTLPQLRNANTIYRNLRILDDAAYRGRNEAGTFTGAQLGDAMGANNRQFGQRGYLAQTNSPFHQLQQDMQAVLPNKVPPTGVNLAPALAIAGAAGGAGGAVTDNDALKWTTLLSLAALPYTKAGQRATAAALIGGPTRQLVGGAIRRKAGLFGSGALPLLLD